MNQLYLRSIIVKKYRPQRSNKPIISKENLLNQDFSTKTICEKWADDITYIPTKKNGWCYLSSIMDLHTKKWLSTFQKEEVYTTSYSDFEEANRVLFSYIEEFYNRNQIPSSIHYLTPQEFEEFVKEKMA